MQSRVAPERTTRLRAWALALGVAALTSPASGARASDAPADAVLAASKTSADPASVETIYVWGKRELKIGEAVSASEGQVSYGAFAQRPLLRPGELAEVIPGLAVTQHSGSGKANQYFLRGFNLDHGTDFSVALDGVPLNLRSHAHGQGYLDLNAVTPELVDTITYRKGPYYAEVGDFSAAGTAGFNTFQHVSQNFIQVQAGEHDYGRVLGAYNLRDAGLVGVDLTTSDGPWVNPERLRKGSVIGRFNVGGDWSVTALAYGARWNSSDQIPLRAVKSGQLSPLGFIDPTDGGKTSRYILSARRKEADSDIVVYVQKYSVSLWSDFTYFLNDPINGDQFKQAEDRGIYGGSASKTWRPIGPDWTFRAGVETRFDDIGKIGLYRTKARQVLSTDRQDRVKEWSGAAWGDAEWDAGPWRATVGIRADDINVDVASSNARNSGSKNEAFLSPKVTIAYRVSPEIELYADAGRGYHSNDARGVVQTVAPVTLDPVAPAPLFSRAEGAEVGARYENGGFTTTASFWGLKLSSELVYQGDSGDTATTSATTRTGVELLVNWLIRPGIDLDLAAAATHARYDDNAAGGNRIPNALEYVVTAGATVRVSANSSAEITVRRVGPAPLIETNAARSRPATVANLSYNYNIGSATLSVEMLNVFDSRNNDITYFYTSRLRGEPIDGVDDYHFHPVEPREVRAAIRYSF